MTKSRFSSLTTWTIRILLVLIAVICVALLILSNMGGTSEQHKKGLEQAFSEYLKADVEIKSIEEFNVMPQFSLKLEGVHGIFKDTKNEFMADELRIAFGLWDLTVGSRKIEDFQLKNLRLSKDSAYDLKVDHAGIVPGKDAVFASSGTYYDRAFDVKIPLLQDDSSRTSYRFNEANHIEGSYGSLRISGDIVPSAKPEAKIVQNIKIMHGANVVAEGSGVRDKTGIKITLDCIHNIDAKSLRTEFEAIKKISFITLSGNCP